MRRLQSAKKSANMGIFAAILVILFFISLAAADENLITPHALQNSETPQKNQWGEIAFTDIAGQKQTIADAKAQGPVVLHLFTIWCSACTRQLTASTEFLKENREVTVISLGIDPKESEKDIQAHISKNGFQGVFAVAPQQLISALTKEFGSEIALRIPQTIVITDDSATYIGAGIVSKQRMKNAVSGYL
jgi:cytochrome oxidase Cu insertion factor (SCO1/SenC/PrrC family)